MRRGVRGSPSWAVVGTVPRPFAVMDRADVPKLACGRIIAGSPVEAAAHFNARVIRVGARQGAASNRTDILAAVPASVAGRERGLG